MFFFSVWRPTVGTMPAVRLSEARDAHAAPSGTEASWAAVGAIGLAAFALVTTEFLPVGLLPAMADSLGQTDGRMGLLLTAPGLAATVAAPASLLLAGTLDRRRVLAGLIVLMILSNLIVARADHFEGVLLGRTLAGVAVGSFWTLGGTLGTRLRPRQAVTAGVVILSGVSLGTVAGVPAGALLGDLLGWRWAFGVAGAIGWLVLLLVLAWMPPLPAQPGRGLLDVPMVLGLPKVRLGVVALVLVFAGQFSAYTYAGAFLLQVTGVAQTTLSAVLLSYGLAALVGNGLGGWASARSARGALVGTGLLLGVSVLLLALVGRSTDWAVVLCLLWGLGFGMLPIAMQGWMFGAAPRHLEAVQAICVSLSQVAIAAGAWAGGLLVDQLGVVSALWLGALAALAGASVVAAGPVSGTGWIRCGRH